ncbi:MAG: hypothetical protein EHM58_09740 [Ignavibacteriae bacterium]|nr:MAG: hypothetical protein EHM58_09740 [Ignavibacteriota bacterium]
MQSINIEYYIFAFLWAIVIPIICYFTAKKKDKSPLFWMFMGMFFGIFALLFLTSPRHRLKNKKYPVNHEDRLNSKLKLYETMREIEEEKGKSLQQN